MSPDTIPARLVPEPGSDAVIAAFGPRLMRLSNRVRRILDARLRPQGLSQAKWRALLILRDSAVLLQKDLAGSLGIEGPSLVRLLDVLESDGLIERRVMPTDRRGKTVHLTPAGEQAVRDIQRVTDQVRHELLGGIPLEQLDACLALFDALEHNADAMDAAPNGAMAEEK